MDEQNREPIFSILIPCYKRSVEVVHTLQKTLEQSHPNFEIVVIDDCTPDSSVEDAVKAFGTVRYIRSDRNRGVVGVRNYGVQFCRGKYIVNLDDDSWMENSDALEKLEVLFHSAPLIGIVSFNINVNATGYPWASDTKPFPCSSYTGCGHAFERTALQIVGPYTELYCTYGEELELSLRFIDAGYTIMAAPSIMVFHDESQINRNRARAETFTAINWFRREIALAPLIFLPLSVGRAFLHLLAGRKGIDWPMFWREAFGKGKSIFLFAGKLRKPVRIRSYVKWIRLKFEDRRQLQS